MAFREILTESAPASYFDDGGAEDVQIPGMYELDGPLRVVRWLFDVEPLYHIAGLAAHFGRPVRVWSPRPSDGASSRVDEPMCQEELVKSLLYLEDMLYCLGPCFERGILGEVEVFHMELDEDVPERYRGKGEAVEQFNLPVRNWRRL